jgi:hypothetical protein
MKLNKAWIERQIAQDGRDPINEGWIEHGRCVGQTAGVIAEAMGLDKDYAECLGMIHDIGKRNTRDYVFHDVLGYQYLIDQGIDEADAAVCLTHSYLNNDDACVAGGYLPANGFRTKYIRSHTYTTYEKIINLCDLMCTNQRMTLEARLIELLTRKGVHGNTAYHLAAARALKKWFDDQIPGGVYRLFPDLTTLGDLGVTSFDQLPDSLRLNSTGVQPTFSQNTALK